VIPVADGSLTAASQGTMRQMYSVLYNRVLTDSFTVQGSGYAAGDAKEAATTDTPIADPKKEDPKNEDPKKEDPKKEDPKKEDPKKEDPKKEDLKKEEPKKAEHHKTTSTNHASKPTEKIKGAWIQLLGDDVGQSKRDGVPGYDAQMLGAIIGKDWLVCPQWTVGLAAGYQHADVDSRGPSGSFFDIKRYQGTLYSGYTFKTPFYLLGALTFAGNRYDDHRKILVPPYAGTPIVHQAQAFFTGWESNAYLETGFIWTCKNFRATPKVMLMVSHFDFEGYTERDALGYDLYVKYDKMNFLPLGGGLKLEYINEFETALVIPEVHGYYFYDFINDKQLATALFTAGGFEFLSQGATPARSSYEVGLSFAVHSDIKTSVALQYDYVGRENYHRHQGFIKIRHEWA